LISSNVMMVSLMTVLLSLMIVYVVTKSCDYFILGTFFYTFHIKTLKEFSKNVPRLEFLI
jgi:hypothetical protein